MKERKKRTFKVRDYHKFYRNELAGKSSPAEFGKVLRRVNQLLAEEIIMAGKILYLPYGFGSVYLKKRKASTILNDDFEVESTTVPVNWVKTWALWKADPQARAADQKIYMDNAHSNDEVYRFVWKRDRKNKSLRTYAYTPPRKMKRGLAKIIKKTGGIQV